MVENLGRKLTLIAVLLTVSLGLLVIPDNPFRLGLDLQGGTRLVYSFDFEGARDRGDIRPEETNADVLRQQIDIIRERVDPDGLLDPIIRSEGTDRVVIELPGTAGTGSRPTVSLADPLPAGVSDGLTLDPTSAALKDFPRDGGGDVQIGEERIRYTQRAGEKLLSLQRGRERTQEVDHEAGEEVVLLSGDPIQTRIENLGDLRFMILAQPGDLADTDLVSERERLKAWLEAHPGQRVANFNAVSRDAGGPHPRLSWYPYRQEVGGTATEFDRAQACLKPDAEHAKVWTFRGDALGKVFHTIDDYGYPCVGFEMQPARRFDFAEFTGANINRQMAIVLNETIFSAPVLQARLSGSSRITGKFTNEEVRDLVTVLRTGSLRIKPTLENSESVGPTLGHDYVNRGLFSGLMGLLAVLAFMILYYRRLGIYSALSLGSTMLMLMGGMAFMRATLTLPGIAGIILTVGMAVDANILIFDRIREEMDKGRNVKQAAKNGFQNAMSAILDANITTLITSLILYNFGTGPVRGFAVTLSVGVVTSVFSALVITRVLVHYALEGGVKSLPMGSWFAQANYSFLSKARYAIFGSALFITIGLVLFASLDKNRKLGIDFLGGATMQVRTEQGHETDEIRQLVANVEQAGGVKRSIEVKPVLDSGSGDGRYTAFRITYKSSGQDEGEDESGRDTRFENDVKSALREVIQRGPVDVSVSESDGAAHASIVLYFEDPHPTDDIAAHLSDAAVDNASVTADEARPGVFSATGDVARGVGPLVLRTQIENAFTNRDDSRGVRYTLKSPVPEASSVGRQVVGELRDNAIAALLLSLFAIVMYIRVRFAEYSYGIAAVVALAHDVLATIGILAIVMMFTDLAVEINLPMIAAFLTIIGYSLNDTIVMFDRVRENLPRSKAPLREILDLSINQTLSRTIMTSLTTFIAVSLLFIFNFRTSNVLVGFSLAMICGVIVGTYSSIFIACPVLHFLEVRASRREQAAAAAVVSDRPSKAAV